VTETQPVTDTADTTDTTDGGYAWLAPLFVELAATEPDDPSRRRLRDRLVEEHLPVAQHVARRFSRRGEPLADLEQVATVGLINAVDRFEPDRGIDFLSFAVPTITGEVRRYFRDHGWAMRVPRRLKELHVALGAAVSRLSQQLGRAPTARELAIHLDLPFEDVLEGLTASNAYRSASLDGMVDEEAGGGHFAAGLLGQYDDQLERLENREALAPLLAELPDRERTILVLRFFGNLTQTQIAERVGISQMHVSRLLSQTLAVLREKLDAG
jgi:RNA polymerase sigma-B factor